MRIILAASDGDDWVYHRGRGTVRKPLDEITLTNGLPYLAPEIVLLYKSRSDRPKDTEDFHDVAALLDPSRRAWLHARIAPRYPTTPGSQPSSDPEAEPGTHPARPVGL